MENKDEIISELFEKHNDEYLNFDKIPIEDRHSGIPDLCALIYLSKFLKEEYRNRDIIRGSEHDEIYLMGLEELIEIDDKTLDDFVIYLTRCGVRYDKYCGCFSMFT